MAEKYDPQKVQAKWQPKWREMGLYKTSDDRSRPKFYCLDFFPYPSGNGLSVGHLRNYVPTDVISRMKRMQGFNVLHPMGWDAFGLPAENFAIKMGVHPALTTEKNASNYRRQLTLAECGYDWEREINSTDPDYYRWTQWFFLLLYKRGLAYKATGAQWWCPECRTILANEQVEQGQCWRCESQVEKKDLNQWFFKITEYADRLIDDLKTVDWPDRIKKMQENWIGKSMGAEVNFRGINPVSGEEYDIPIFTTRVDTIFGVTFMTLAPEHPLVEKLTHPDNKAAVEAYISDSRKKSEIDRLSTEKEKTGVNLGGFAINPFNGEKVPVFIGDYVLYGYGTGAVMAVPAHDERDFAFAKKYNLPVKEVITPAGKAQGDLKAAFTEYGTLINSGQFDGLTSEQAIEKMIAWLGWGGYILPITFVILGLWFLLSRMDNFPNISLERLLGVTLLFFNLVAWLSLVSAGGQVGTSLHRSLVSALGKVGAVILLIAWLLAGLILLVDLSMADLILWLADKFKHNQSKFADFLRRKANQQRADAEVEECFEQSAPSTPTSERVYQAPRVAAAELTQSLSSSQPHWVLPEPTEMLDPIPEAPIDGESDEDRARVIEETLRSFSTPAHVVEIRRGPTVTLFGVEPDFIESRSGRTRVRVSNIVRLSDDLALALKASRIRVKAPVPGKGYVGVEVPNQKSALVSLLEIVESPSFVNKKSPLKFALGKDVSGAAVTTDLASMPHLLIAGTTGSGKSVCVNAILAGYLLNLTPDQLRIVLVDPKRVELTGYNGIPHLLAPVIVEAEKVVGALQWMLREMDLRYRTFSTNGARNITEYNDLMAKQGGKQYPFILVVIDELADLMMLAPEETGNPHPPGAVSPRDRHSPDFGYPTAISRYLNWSDQSSQHASLAVASGVDSRVILINPGLNACSVVATCSSSARRARASSPAGNLHL